MIKYPEIQSKVQAEIHDKVGLSRPVTMEDKVNLPFPAPEEYSNNILDFSQALLENQLTKL